MGPQITKACLGAYVSSYVGQSLLDGFHHCPEAVAPPWTTRDPVTSCNLPKYVVILTLEKTCIHCDEFPARTICWLSSSLTLWHATSRMDHCCKIRRADKTAVFANLWLSKGHTCRLVQEKCRCEYKGQPETLLSLDCKSGLPLFK